MKITTSVLQMFIDVGQKSALKQVKEAGFDGVDFPLYWSKYHDTLLGENYKEVAIEEKNKLLDANLICNQTHAPFMHFQYENVMDESDEMYLRLVRAIEVTSIFGAEYIVIHNVKVPDGVDFFEYNLKYFKSFEKYCKKFNVKIAVENLYKKDEKRDCYVGRLGKPEELNSFLDALNSPYYVACVDIGHAALTGVEPEDYILGVKKEYLKVFHIHDNNYKADNHYLPYFGLFDWNKITKAIAKAGYEGNFNLETECIRYMDEDFKIEGLKFTYKIAKKLVEKIEEYKKTEQ
ncbi:MAG: sugar phosphate isomerase/epimerase [Ruminococcaceae bacterium]|nr:sugar phosphate isomerase/epimerase [Oscillospiraceae bacterium]